MVLTAAAPVDSEQNARVVRQDTAELASYLLSDGTAPKRPSFLQRSRGSVQELFSQGQEDGADRIDDAASTTILEEDEPVSPPPEAQQAVVDGGDGPSVLSNMLRRSPPQSFKPDAPIQHKTQQVEDKQQSSKPVGHQSEAVETDPATERTPLLPRPEHSEEPQSVADIEGQKAAPTKKWFGGLIDSGRKLEGHLVHATKVVVNPRRWDGKAIWHNVVEETASCLPAVAVGLLLNILDALSYGKTAFLAINNDPVC